jgi:hypothetical protein
VGLVADFSSTMFVVPVSLDLQSQEEGVGAMVEEAAAQEAAPIEQKAEFIAEEMSNQDLSPEGKGHAESQAEAEVASHGPASEMDEIEEIEQMLNEEHPLKESVDPARAEHSAKSGLLMSPAEIKEPVLEAVPDTQASVNGKKMEYSLGKGKPMEGMHLRQAGKPVESMIITPASKNAFGGMTQRAAVNTMDASEDMLREPSIPQKQTMDVHPTDKHGDEHANDHVIETETELDPHHL